MESVVDVFAAWRVDRTDVFVSKVPSFGEFCGRDGPVFGGKTGEDLFGEGSGLDLVFEEDRCCLGFWVQRFADDLWGYDLAGGRSDDETYQIQICLT